MTCVARLYMLGRATADPPLPTPYSAKRWDR